MSNKKENLDKLNEAIEILRHLVYYSQIHTVKGVRPADMETHDEAWRKGQKFLWDNCLIRYGRYYYNERKSKMKSHE